MQQVREVVVAVEWNGTEWNSSLGMRLVHTHLPANYANTILSNPCGLRKNFAVSLYLLDPIVSLRIMF